MGPIFPLCFFSDYNTFVTPKETLLAHIVESLNNNTQRSEV